MSFTYNVAGSMVCKSVSGLYETYTHDFLQRLITVHAGTGSCTGTGGNVYTYKYDGVGRRVNTIDYSGYGSYFMYSGGTMLYSKVNNPTGFTETAYVYVGGRLLFRKDGTASTPEARYYYQDISGNVRFISYWSTSVQDESKYRYQPFGQMFAYKNALSRFDYARQEHDVIQFAFSEYQEPLYHMGARYYDPNVGRFIERDPIGSGYSYANNNPISFTDPSGATAVLHSAEESRQTRAWNNLLMVVMLTLAAPVSGGMSSVLLAGFVTRVIFLLSTLVVPNGQASGTTYIEAFTTRFIVGTVVASVYVSFRVAGTAV